MLLLHSRTKNGDCEAALPTVGLKRNIHTYWLRSSSEEVGERRFMRQLNVSFFDRQDWLIVCCRGTLQKSPCNGRCLQWWVWKYEYGGRVRWKGKQPALSRSWRIQRWPVHCTGAFLHYDKFLSSWTYCIWVVTIICKIKSKIIGTVSVLKLLRSTDELQVVACCFKFLIVFIN